MVKLLRILAALAASTLAIADDSSRTPPTLRLGDAAAPISYEAHLAIDPREAEFTGEVRIALRFDRATPVLWLNATNLRIESVEFRQGARAIAVEVIPAAEDFVGFEAKGEPFAPGEAAATIRYQGTFDLRGAEGLFRQQERGESYVISQFEETSARRAFPCFDEPGWKTPWQSNTPQTGLSPLSGRPGWRRHEFKRTPPLPSYLVAMAVGPFDVVDGGTAGINKTPIRYFAPKGRGAEMRYAREATPRLIEILEDYFGTPYPFEKLDSVSIPQVNFGAMENVGMITYASTLLLATPHEETARFQRSYASVAAHEIAHMWFGNLVTLAWWDDTWLNESFASWMQEKALGRYRPDWDDGSQNNMARASAITADRLASARVINNPVLTKDDIDGAFDSITYSKGSQVLAMFEAWFTPQRFREGVQLFLKRHAWGTATSPDFFRALGEASGREERALQIFNAFVSQPGVPLIDAKLDCGAGAPSLEVSQRRLRPAGSTAAEMRWVTPACFHYAVKGREETQCAEVANGAQRIVLAQASQCPDWIVGNALGAGHYVVRYDAALAKRLAGQTGNIPGPEVLALVTNATLLSTAGLMPLEEALAVADAALGHASPAVQQSAVLLLKELRDEWLDARQSRLKRELAERRIEPLARKLGWRASAGDSVSMSTLRAALLPFAAERERGTANRAAARELAMQWLADRESVPANLAAPVLDTAGRFADEAIYAKLQAAAIASHDRRERNNLLHALAKARDPKLRERALSLSLDQGLSATDALNLLEDALRDDANRWAAFEFVRAHFDALVAKLPQDKPGALQTPMGRFCTKKEREAFVDFFQGRAARFLGGQRRYDQALESIELCIAARAGLP